MTRRPLIHAGILITIPPPPPFRVSEQRLYAIIGRSLSRMTVRDQRIYMINDFSSVTLYRYWRIWALDSTAINFNIANIEMRATVGGADATGTGTEIAYGGVTDPISAFNGDLSNWSSGSISSSAIERGLGYDFGAGNEIAIAQVAMSRGTASTYGPFRNFEVQASNDQVDWQMKLRVTDEAVWSPSETREYAI